MAKLFEIFDVINEVAPFESAMEFDNVGILVGDKDAEINRAIIALDITPDVIKEAESKNCNLIISHHPVIFTPIRAISSKDIPYMLASKGIYALCCHTNIDLSPVCGSNIALGEKLELKNIKGAKEYGEGYIIYSGELVESLEPKAFANYVKSKLNAGAVKLMAGDRNIKKVLFSSGSAGEYAEEAAYLGADAYITGEMKHHEELIARELDITVVSAGHFETEKPYGELLLEHLSSKIKDTSFILSVNEKAPYEWV